MSIRINDGFLFFVCARAVFLTLQMLIKHLLLDMSILELVNIVPLRPFLNHLLQKTSTFVNDMYSGFKKLPKGPCFHLIVFSFKVFRLFKPRVT